MTSAAPLKLTPAQRKTLEARIRMPTLPQGVAVRARICLLAATGMANLAISRKLDISCTTVLLWRRRFQKLGIAGLTQDAPRRPSARRLDARLVRRIVDATRHTVPPSGAQRWTTRTLAAQFGVGSATVARIWNAHGLHPRRASARKPAQSQQRRANHAAQDVGKSKRTGDALPQSIDNPTIATDTTDGGNARPSRTTQRDIARRVGVSLATVSLALRDHARISADIRARVLQAAKKLGYTPDPMLSALATHRWHRRSAGAGATLAALADGPLEFGECMPACAATHGYNLEIFPLRDYPDPQRLADVLYARGIQGLIVGQIFTPGFCEAFDWSRFVSVACREGDARPPIHMVMPNHFRAVQQAWDWAHNRGFRRIGLAIFDQPSAIDPQDRYAAFLERQQHVPAAQRVSLLAIKPWADHAAPKPGMIRHSAAVQQTRAWMQQERPDMVLGFNSSFRWLLHDAGWRAPQWNAFVDLWVEDAVATGMRLENRELVRRAVDWLVALLRTSERGLPLHPSTLSIDFAWQDGTSLHLPARRNARATVSGQVSRDEADSRLRTQKRQLKSCRTPLKSALESSGPPTAVNGRGYRCGR